MLNHPVALESRADASFHHDRLVAPASCPGSQYCDLSTRQGGVISCSQSCPWPRSEVFAGCRSLRAIWENTADLTGAELEALGLEAGQALPSQSTIRRVLQDLDPADLDARLRSWLCTLTGTIEGPRVIAVDCKTMRAARTDKDPAPHLLSALDHATGTVLTQRGVADKSNEIPALPELGEPLDLDGAVARRRRYAHPT